MGSDITDASGESMAVLWLVQRPSSRSKTKALVCTCMHVDAGMHACMYDWRNRSKMEALVRNRR